jgi:hypothetical protein
MKAYYQGFKYRPFALCQGATVEITDKIKSYQLTKIKKPPRLTQGGF